MTGGTRSRRVLLLLLLIGVAAPAASGVVTDGEISITNWHSNVRFRFSPYKVTELIHKDSSLLFPI
jgi:hypothetical protein